jgi:hypothetical protein
VIASLRSVCDLTMHFRLSVQSYWYLSLMKRVEIVDATERYGWSHSLLRTPIERGGLLRTANPY